MYEKLAARAGQLMDSGPGRVKVDRLGELGVAHKLRTARSALTGAEAGTIAETIAELKNQLTGIEALSSPMDEPSSWRQALLPPPQALLDAAEAWLIAEIVEEGLGESLDDLRLPWLQASVT